MYKQSAIVYAFWRLRYAGFLIGVDLMFSEKMMSLGKKSSVIREIFEYSKLRKAEIGEDKVFDFSLGNPSIPSPTAVTEAMKKLILNKDPVSLHGYTSAPGDINVRNAIAVNIKKRFGADCEASNIYMTCGAAASLTITLKAICNIGDEVIILAPFFPEYRVFIENAGAVPIVVKCKESDLQIDIAAVEAAITDKTRAIIINSPNNPTGVVFTRKNLSDLADMLMRKSAMINSNIFIIADEPYRELTYDDVDVPYIPNIYVNTIVCYSYSKSLSLPGERIGYIFVSPKSVGASDLFAAVCGAGRSMGFVCAPSLLQYTIAECDGMMPEISAYDRNRKLLYNTLTEIGYEAIKPDGAFYLFVKAFEKNANKFCETAKKYELLLVPSDDFGFDGYVRIAYCVSYEQIKRSLPAFRALYDEYKR